MHYKSIPIQKQMNEEEEWKAAWFRPLTSYSSGLTGCLQSSSGSESFSTLGTGGVSWWRVLLPVWGDALSAEPVSTAGRDWILQDVLTQSTAGQLLLHRNTTLPLPSVERNTSFIALYFRGADSHQRYNKGDNCSLIFKKGSIQYTFVIR